MKPNHLHWLNPDNPEEPFPDVENALREPNGLLAIGGDLGPHRLLTAYRNGIFPWYNPDEPILWWSPDPRTVFTPQSVRISRSMRRVLNRADYAVTLDRAFDTVLEQCAAPRVGQRGTWLGPAMREAYRRLHALGHAHSVEVWRNRRLIGGLYGVSLGHVFFGESMFSRVENGSKLALIHLARQLTAWRFTLIDGQVGSAHLYRMGAFDIPRARFQKVLKNSLAERGESGLWRFSVDCPQEARHLPATLRRA